jgi:arabinofuranosyltransferase
VNRYLSARNLLCILLTLLLSLAVISVMDLRLIGVDDANILFVYSKHLAAGEGLVYNIGGERVEGYSSASWMLLTSLGYFLTAQPAPVFFVINILLIGLALSYGSLVVAELLGINAANSAKALTTFPVAIWLAWTVANPSYFIWTTTSLLETGLWSALLLTSTFLLLRSIGDGVFNQSRLISFTVLNMLLLLTRPESMAWVLYFLAMLLIVLRHQGISIPALGRRWLPIAVAAAACLGALIAFRLSYFGFPLPNTYYAKMDPDRIYEIRWGLVYLRDFLAYNSIAGILILLALVIFGRYTPGVVRTLILGRNVLTNIQLARFCAASATLAGVLLPVLMGGDIFGAFRFFQPVWPLLILSALLLPLPAAFLQTTNTRTAFFALAALCVFTLAHTIRWPSLSADRGRVAHLYELTHRGILTGQYIQEIFPAATAAELPTVGASAAGGYKMGYPGVVIDTMGLNFTPMAHHDGDKRGTRGHASFNKEVFWRYATDLLEPTLCPAKGEPVNRYKNPDNWIFTIYREIFTDEAFIGAYRFVAIKSPQSGGWLCSYVKRDLVQTLEATGKYQIIAVD